MSNVEKFGCGAFLPGKGPGNVGDPPDDGVDGGEERVTPEPPETGPPIKEPDSNDIAFVCIPKNVIGEVPEGADIASPGPKGGFLVGINNTPTGAIYTYKVCIKIVNECVPVPKDKENDIAYLYGLSNDGFKNIFNPDGTPKPEFGFTPDPQPPAGGGFGPGGTGVGPSPLNPAGDLQSEGPELYQGCGASKKPSGFIGPLEEADTEDCPPIKKCWSYQVFEPNDIIITPPGGGGGGGKGPGSTGGPVTGGGPAPTTGGPGGGGGPAKPPSAGPATGGPGNPGGGGGGPRICVPTGEPEITYEEVTITGDSGNFFLGVGQTNDKKCYIKTVKISQTCIKALDLDSVESQDQVKENNDLIKELKEEASKNPKADIVSDSGQFGCNSSDGCPDFVYTEDFCVTGSKPDSPDLPLIAKCVPTGEPEITYEKVANPNPTTGSGEFWLGTGQKDQTKPTTCYKKTVKIAYNCYEGLNIAAAENETQTKDNINYINDLKEEAENNPKSEIVSDDDGGSCVFGGCEEFVYTTTFCVTDPDFDPKGGSGGLTTPGLGGGGEEGGGGPTTTGGPAAGGPAVPGGGPTKPPSAGTTTGGPGNPSVGGPGVPGDGKTSLCIPDEPLTAEKEELGSFFTSKEGTTYKCTKFKVTTTWSMKCQEYDEDFLDSLGEGITELWPQEFKTAIDFYDTGPITEEDDKKTTTTTFKNFEFNSPISCEYEDCGSVDVESEVEECIPVEIKPPPLIDPPDPGSGFQPPNPQGGSGGNQTLSTTSSDDNTFRSLSDFNYEVSKQKNFFVNLNSYEIKKLVSQELPTGVYDEETYLSLVPYTSIFVQNTSPYKEIFADTINNNLNYILKYTNSVGDWTSNKINGLTLDTIMGSLKPEVVKYVNSIRNVDGSFLSPTQIFNLFFSRIVQGKVDELTVDFFKNLSEYTDKFSQIQILKSTNPIVNEVFAFSLLENNTYSLDLSSFNDINKNFAPYKVFPTDTDTHFEVTYNGTKQKIYVNDDDTFVFGSTFKMSDGEFFDLKVGRRSYRFFAKSERDHSFYIPDAIREKVLDLFFTDSAKILSVSADVSSNIEFDYSLTKPRQPLYAFSCVLETVTSLPEGAHLVNTKAKYQLLDTSSESGLNEFNTFLSTKSPLNKRTIILDDDDLILDYAEEFGEVYLSQTDIVPNSPKNNKDIPVFVRQIPRVLLLYPTNRPELNVFGAKSHISNIGDREVIRELYCKPSISTELSSTNKNEFIKFNLSGTNATNVYGNYNSQFRVLQLNVSDDIFSKGYKDVSGNLYSASSFERTRERTGFRKIKEVVTELNNNYYLNISGKGKSLSKFDVFSRLNLKEFINLKKLNNFNSIMLEAAKGLFSNVKIIDTITNSSQRVSNSASLLFRRKPGAPDSDSYAPIKNTNSGAIVTPPTENQEGRISPK